MALFGFLKKKKEEEELPPPPPPSPPELPAILKGEIEEIRPAAAEEAAPPIPPPPSPAMPPLEAPPKFEMPKIAAPLPELPEKPPEVKPELPAEEVPAKIIPAKPIFVSVEDYRRITADSDAIRARLMKTEEFVKRLGDLKNEEEKIFQKWRGYLEALEKKLDYVDKLIAKAKG